MLSKVTDVVIIGSNLGGSLLANILAKNNISVIMVDPSPHPKFSIGEATTPDTSCKFKIISKKYDIPEINNLSNFNDLSSYVGSQHGIKKSFSFLYHREGSVHCPNESHQFPTPDNGVLGPDCHFFRQDTDAYIYNSAIKYGAKSLQAIVKDVIFKDDSVTVICDGVEISCSYVYDASGRNSILANKLQLREPDDHLETDSRGIFNHMVDVEHYKGAHSKWPFTFKNLYGLKSPLPQSTLHHVFKGGWMWIIPFDNNDKTLNPLCSVGLMLDRKKYPVNNNISPEEEFYSFVNRFPSIKKQLEFAKPVRNWTRLDKVQYSSKSITGHRYCLSANSAGFVDPLYSSGIGLTLSVVDLLAEQLLESFKSRDFNVEKFKNINTFFNDSLTHYDEMVSNSYFSFNDYRLWDAWFRVWVTGNFLGSLSNIQLLFSYASTKDKKHLYKTSSSPYRSVLGIQLKEQNRFFAECYRLMEELKSNNSSKEAAINEILNMIKSHELIPSYFHWSNKNVRCMPDFGALGTIKLYLWAMMQNNNHNVKRLFSYNPLNSFILPYAKK